MVPDRYLDSMSVPVHERMWRHHLREDRKLGDGSPGPWTVTLVADASGAGVVGFLEGGPEREGVPGYEAELNALYLIAPWQRHGLGGRLVHAFVRELPARGASSMLVWALAANPARAFYRRMGGVEISHEPDLIGATVLEKVAYGWTDLSISFPPTG